MKNLAIHPHKRRRVGPGLFCVWSSSITSRLTQWRSAKWTMRAVNFYSKEYMHCVIFIISISNFFLVCFLFFLVTPRSFCCACLADCHFNFIWMKRLALPQTLTFIFIDFIIDLESELTVSKNKSGSNSKTHNFTGHFILHNLIKKERKGWFT